jgi:putative transposase
LSCENDLPERDRWARLRFAIIGPLLAAPPATGDLQSALQGLAARTWRHPSTGLPIRFGASTIERWYSAEQIVLRSGTVLQRIPRD